MSAHAHADDPAGTIPALNHLLYPEMRRDRETIARLERDLAARDAQAAKDFDAVQRLTAENAALRQELGRRERAGRYVDEG